MRRRSHSAWLISLGGIDYNIFLKNMTIHFCGTARAQRFAAKLPGPRERDVEAMLAVPGHHRINVPHAEQLGPCQNTKTKDQCQSHLFRLPIEIRLAIWRLLLADKTVPLSVWLRSLDIKPPGQRNLNSMSLPPQWRPVSLVKQGRSLDPKARVTSSEVLLKHDVADVFPMAVVRTCRRVYYEAINVFYTHNTFYMQDVVTIPLLPSFIPLESLRSVRSLHLNLTCYMPMDEDIFWADLKRNIEDILPSLQSLTVEVCTWQWRANSACYGDGRGWDLAEGQWYKPDATSAFLSMSFIDSGVAIEKAISAASFQQTQISHIKFIFGWPKTAPSPSSGPRIELVHTSTTAGPLAWVSDEPSHENLLSIETGGSISYERAFDRLKANPAHQIDPSREALFSLRATAHWKGTDSSIEYGPRRTRDQIKKAGARVVSTLKYGCLLFWCGPFLLPVVVRDHWRGRVAREKLKRERGQQTGLVQTA